MNKILFLLVILVKRKRKRRKIIKFGHHCAFIAPFLVTAIFTASQTQQRRKYLQN